VTYFKTLSASTMTIIRIPGIFHDEQTVIICPYCCDNVLHYHGADADKPVYGHRVGHCFWYLREQPQDDGYEIVPATPEQAKIIRDWLPRAEHLNRVNFRSAGDEERRQVLAQLIGDDNLPPKKQSKLSRYLKDGGV